MWWSLCLCNALTWTKICTYEYNLYASICRYKRRIKITTIELNSRVLNYSLWSNSQTRSMVISVTRTTHPKQTYHTVFSSRPIKGKWNVVGIHTSLLENYTTTYNINLYWKTIRLLIIGFLTVAIGHGFSVIVPSGGHHFLEPLNELSFARKPQIWTSGRFSHYH